MDEYLTIQEAAKLFKMHERTLARLCKQGKIKGAIQIGGFKSEWRIPTPNFRGTDE